MRERPHPACTRASQDEEQRGHEEEEGPAKAESLEEAQTCRRRTAQGETRQEGRPPPPGTLDLRAADFISSAKARHRASLNGRDAIGFVSETLVAFTAEVTSDHPWA